MLAILKVQQSKKSGNAINEEPQFSVYFHAIFQTDKSLTEHSLELIRKFDVE